MAKHGIKGVVGVEVAEGGAMRRVVELYREALARAGRKTELGENLSIGFHFYIAGTQRKAVEEAARYFEENLEIFGPLRLVRSLTDQQIEEMGEPKRAPCADLPRLEGGVKAGAFLCDPPEQIVEQLKGLEEQYPGLERFAEEVMPAFERRVEAGAPAG